MTRPCIRHSQSNLKDKIEGSQSRILTPRARFSMGRTENYHASASVFWPEACVDKALGI